jgi:hypothetical protein
MDGFAQTESLEDAVDHVTSNLLFEFRDALPADVIAKVARECVEELHRQSIRIKTFVPLLALRRARERLRVSSMTSPPGAFGEQTAG